MRAEHTIDVSIKDNRVRVKISADNMIYRGGTKGVYDYMIVNAAPINDGKQPFNVTKKWHYHILRYYVVVLLQHLMELIRL